jgi:hypothetical protein
VVETQMPTTGVCEPRRLDPQRLDLEKPMKLLLYITIWTALSSWALFAKTVLPIEIESKHAGNGDTTHDNVNCRFYTSGDPNLIQCYLTIDGDLLKELHVSMLLSRGATTLASVNLDGYEKKTENGKSRIFNFAIHPKMLEESQIDIHSDPFGNGPYLRINMKNVELLQHKQEAGSK